MNADQSYDPLGRRNKTIVNGVTTYNIYDGWDLIERYDTSGNKLESNVFGTGTDEIIARTVGATTYFYQQDSLGNVTHVYASGALAESYTYDAYGVVTIRTPAGAVIPNSAIGNRFMFTGREYLSEINLYDYRNRFYSAELGRFLEPDPSGFAAGDENLYRYVGNNPVNRTDPTGLKYNIPKKADGGGSSGRSSIFGPGTSSIGGRYLGSYGTGRVPTGSHIGEIVKVYDNGDGTFKQISSVSGDLGNVMITSSGVESVVRGEAMGANAEGEGLGSVGDVIGKIWTLPNTIIGLALGVVSLPFGGHVDWGYNAVVFSNVPFMRNKDRIGAMTFGNAILNGGPFEGLGASIKTYYAVEHTAAAAFANKGFAFTNFGKHEEGHTYQYQRLGPLYGPLYLLSNPFSSQSPFENAADRYGAGLGNY